MKAFLSYSFKNVDFVARVYRYLVQQKPRIDPYFYTNHRRADEWPRQLEEALRTSEAFVLFLGNELGKTQEREMGSAFLYGGIRCKLWVQLSEQIPESARDYCARLDPIRCTILPAKPKHDEDVEALKCAKEIMRILCLKWIAPDDVPERYIFAYEKDIIQAYIDRGQDEFDERLPTRWPSVCRSESPANIKNPVSPEAIGKFRSDTESVVVDARLKKRAEELRFPEAGPREMLCFPNPHKKNELRVGILVSGGIAPGINAVIDGIVNRHFLYSNPPEDERNEEVAYAPYTVKIYGYLEGFKALLRGAGNHRFLSPEETSEHAHEGGSILGTSRVTELMDQSLETRMNSTNQLVQTLAGDKIEILYVIGGDGSMRAAHGIWTVAKSTRPELNLSVVGIPKTMDNDILWVWQSFGFLSAVEKAREAIQHLQTEVKSNPRLCVIQLFGSDSGFVVAHAVLASGGCDYALIPEVGFTLKRLCEHLRNVLADRYNSEQRPHGVVVMSETAIPRDIEDYMDEVELTEDERKAIKKFACLGEYAEDKTFFRRVQGQTPDELRTGGLKVIKHFLEREIRAIPGDTEYWREFRVFTNEPRHLIRASPPSVADVIFGQRLGALAVDNAMAGYTDFMVSQWLTEFVLVPLKLVVLGRKRVPEGGIFWKSVLASTGQPMETIE